MTPKWTKYIPKKPTAKQAAFLLLDNFREAMYGGAAGGGKSEALLMGALQYVDRPGYAALILRRTYADLSLPGALMDRAAEWLQPTDAHWSEAKKTWTFPSGATITFGYLEAEKHKYRYQGSEFQYIAFDELTQFTETQYLYLFSRLRRTTEVVGSLPLRMRAASNPGGESHEFVYERFVQTPAMRSRIFIPAGLDDNPHVDKAEYTQSLMELDDITRQQLLDGLWITDPNAHAFYREWWQGKNRYHSHLRKEPRVLARYLSYDTGFKNTEASAESAAVLGELMADYRLRIRLLWAEKLLFPDLPGRIEEDAKTWNVGGKLQAVIIEDKASGTSAYQTLQATAEAWLQDLLVAFQPKGSKLERAKQAGVWCKRDCVLLPYPHESMPQLYDYERQLFAFPLAALSDKVDATSQLLLYLEHYLATGWRARGGHNSAELAA